MLQVLEPGDWAIDVGANLGYHSLIMGALVGRQGKVFSFEPAEKTFQEFLANCKANPELSIEPLKIALADQERESRFLYSTQDSGWSRVVVSKGDQEGSEFSSVITKTLDQVMPKNLDRSIKVIKIDTEGFEERILRGAERLIDSNRLEFVIAEHHGGNLAAAGSTQFTLRDFMVSKGFECYVLGGGATPVFPKFIPQGIEITGRWVCNLLFARANALPRFYKRDDVSGFVVS